MRHPAIIRAREALRLLPAQRIHEMAPEYAAHIYGISIAEAQALLMHERARVRLSA